MPNGIVIETCPAPGSNLADGDIEGLMDEMAAYVGQFRPAFRRQEQLSWCQSYLQGLLGEAVRKNVEQMALKQGEKGQHAAFYWVKPMGGGTDRCHPSTDGGRGSGGNGWGCPDR